MDNSPISEYGKQEALRRALAKQKRQAAALRATQEEVDLWNRELAGPPKKAK